MRYKHANFNADDAEAGDAARRKYIFRRGASGYDGASRGPEERLIFRADYQFNRENANAEDAEMMLVQRFVILHFAVLWCGTCVCAQTAAPEPWPSVVHEIEYLSSGDNTQQKALLYDPEDESPQPLLVVLHSWSGDYTQDNSKFAQWCIDKHWVLIHPNFRGVNDHPEACGSELVVQDILSAVDYCKKKCRVDQRRIYLIGASGGGYASLLMAGRAPQVWTAVSAWCPIHDLKTWHADTLERKLKYTQMLEQVCGGSPGTSQDIDRQYHVRSASSWLTKAKGVRLSINTGITDGHNGSVPVGHTLRAFNDVAAPADRISNNVIERMEAQPLMPDDLNTKTDDPTFGDKPVLFRRKSGSAEVNIFQGGHELVHDAALAWLDNQ